MSMGVIYLVFVVLNQHHWFDTDWLFGPQLSRLSSQFPKLTSVAWLIVLTVLVLLLFFLWKQK